MSTLIDFSEEIPVWLKYAEWVSAKHNKYYEVRIDFSDDSQYVVTKRWGPRPDLGVGQTKQEFYAGLGAAQKAAEDIFRSKLQKGYNVVERPASANKVPLDHEPEAEDEGGEDWY